MKLRLLALLACLSAATATPACAGWFNYGCRGEFNGDTYIFDRTALVILPKGVAKGDLGGLMTGYVDVFDATDSDIALQTAMKFRDGAFIDRQLTLTETSSKVISSEVGKVGTRDREKTIMRKTYHLDRPGPWDERVQGDMVMDCINYMLTAP
jgi:hypothetical protein